MRCALPKPVSFGASSDLGTTLLSVVEFIGVRGAQPIPRLQRMRLTGRNGYTLQESPRSADITPGDEYQWRNPSRPAGCAKCGRDRWHESPTPGGPAQKVASISGSASRRNAKDAFGQRAANRPTGLSLIPPSGILFACEPHPCRSHLVEEHVFLDCGDPVCGRGCRADQRSRSHS